jgi:hypothetical protein
MSRTTLTIDVTVLHLNRDDLSEYTLLPGHKPLHTPPFAIETLSGTGYFLPRPICRKTRQKGRRAASIIGLEYPLCEIDYFFHELNFTRRKADAILDADVF